MAKNETEKLFQMTKPLTKKFKQQVDDEVFDYGYIFKECKTHTAYCTCCKRRFRLDSLEIDGIEVQPESSIKYMRHNEETNCPYCNKSVMVKDAGRGRSRLTNYGYIAVFQNLKDDTLLLRSYALMRNYSGSYENVETKYSEHYRIYYKPTKPTQCYKRYNRYFDHHYYFYEPEEKQTFYKMSSFPKCLSFPSTYWSRLYSNPTPMTFMNLEEIKKNPNFKYFEMCEYIASEVYFPELYIPDCVNMFCKHPVIYEKLQKEGFDKTIAHILLYGWCGTNYRAKTVKDFFRVHTKEEMKIIKSNKYSLRIIEMLLKNGVALTESGIIWAQNNHYCLSTYKGDKKTLEYLIKKNYSLNDYQDYIGWLKKYEISLDKKALYPRYPQEAHDNMMHFNNRKEAERKNKENAELLKRFKKEFLPFLRRVFVYNDETYLIRPFKDIAEIITEGHIQNICVGGEDYTIPYMKGEKYLFCLRKKDDEETPFVTVEVDTKGQLVQYRAKCNAAPAPEVYGFIKKWQQAYQTKLKQYKAKHKKTTKKEVA